MTNYDDMYETCAETSASFRIKHVSLDPDEISTLIGIKPSWGGRKGDIWEGISRPARFGMWALSTDGTVKSRDLRRHLDWLVTMLDGKTNVLDVFRSRGYAMDVFCNWARLGGTGGPTLSPQNMHGLSALGLELAFEFWVVELQEDDF